MALFGNSRKENTKKPHRRKATTYLVQTTEPELGGHSLPSAEGSSFINEGACKMSKQTFMM